MKKLFTLFVMALVTCMGAWAQNWSAEAPFTVSPNMTDGDFSDRTVFYYIKNKDAEGKGTAKWVSTSGSNGFNSTNNSYNEQWAIYGNTTTGYQFVNRATKGVVTSNNSGVSDTSSNDLFVTGGLSFNGTHEDATSYFDIAAAKTSGYFVIAAHDFQNHHYTWSRDGNEIRATFGLGAWYSAAGWNWTGWTANGNGDNGCMFAFEEAETLDLSEYAISFDADATYTGNDIAYQRAIKSITINGETKSIAEYSEDASSKTYNAYRDLTESCVFTITPSAAYNAKINIGSSDNRSWSYGYVYVDGNDDKHFTIADPDELVASLTVSGGVTDFNNTFTNHQVAPSTPGTYRMRIVHGPSNDPAGASGFVAGFYRIVDVTLKVVNYNDEVKEALIAKMRTAVNNINDNKVGYPKSGSASNIATIAAVQNYLDGNPAITLTNYNDAVNALDAVYGLTDLNMPEYGKAYRIAFRQLDGTNKYIASNDAMKTVSTDAGEAAVFVAGNNTSNTVNYPYLFVDNDGRLLRFQNVTGTNLTEAGHDIQIGKTVSYVMDASFTNVTATLEQAFGTVVLIASVGANGSGRWQGITLNTGTDQISEQNWNDVKANFKEGLTAAVVFEEVENPNKLKLSNPNPDGTSGLDNKSLGTFSAPFAVQLPTGVEAYKATIEGSTVSFESIGSVVPANTGVLVYASDGTTYDNVNAVPAARTVVVSDNAFEPVINGTVAIGDYVLGKGSNGVGFYARVTPVTVANKAFIPATAASNLNAFRFDFEDTVTGIEAIESNTDATIFDLQGRRVQKAKSGLYIVNGKKIIR